MKLSGPSTYTLGAEWEVTDQPASNCNPPLKPVCFSTVTAAGVESARDISVRIEPPDTVHVRVPDRYQLHLKLAVPIAAQADTVRFKTKTRKLTMNCLVVSPEQEAAIQAEASGGAQADADSYHETFSPVQADQRAAQAAQQTGADTSDDTSASADQRITHTT
jgi:hypothetical protein